MSKDTAYVIVKALREKPTVKGASEIEYELVAHDHQVITRVANLPSILEVRKIFEIWPSGEAREMRVVFKDGRLRLESVSCTRDSLP